ncbi:MAG: hypothetical protein JWO24_2937 [Rhodospirillales bacterium]|nr:hypothetical protein [Rhodospirillales bacterium]
MRDLHVTCTTTLNDKVELVYGGGEIVVSVTTGAARSDGVLLNASKARRMADWLNEVADGMDSEEPDEGPEVI